MTMTADGTSPLTNVIVRPESRLLGDTRGSPIGRRCAAATVRWTRRRTVSRLPGADPLRRPPGPLRVRP
jgi:hypothetical protein